MRRRAAIDSCQGHTGGERNRTSATAGLSEIVPDDAVDSRQSLGCSSDDFTRFGIDNVVVERKNHGLFRYVHDVPGTDAIA